MNPNTSVAARSSTKRVWFHLPPGPFQDWEGPGLISVLRQTFSEGPPEGWPTAYAGAESPDDADLIVFPEAIYFKTRAYADSLREIDAIRRWPEKCFTINADDAPLPFLRGTYAGLLARWNDPERTIASGYATGSPNPYCAEYEAMREREAELLFSFRGARSAPVRERLLSQADALTKGLSASIRASSRWFNYPEEELRLYLDEIIRSRFVLCPRGQGTASHRLFEVMRLGRVPVILSDAWIPPGGPKWEDFSLRVKERDVASLSAVIRERDRDFSSMAAAARAAWERWYGPGVRLWTILDALAELPAHARVSETAFQRRWDRASFYSANLGTFRERVTRRIGRLFQKR